MPEINDYSDYDEFKKPGLFTIINKNTGTVIDLWESKPEGGTAITGQYVFQYPSTTKPTHVTVVSPMAEIIRNGRLRTLEIAST